jgi:hypothetical protein
MQQSTARQRLELAHLLEPLLWLVLVYFLSSKNLDLALYLY